MNTLHPLRGVATIAETCEKSGGGNPSPKSGVASGRSTRAVTLSATNNTVLQALAANLALLESPNQVHLTFVGSTNLGQPAQTELPPAFGSALSAKCVLPWPRQPRRRPLLGHFLRAPPSKLRHLRLLLRICLVITVLAYPASMLARLLPSRYSAASFTEESAECTPKVEGDTADSVREAFFALKEKRTRTRVARVEMIAPDEDSRWM